ncbi:hypothetical protein K2173_006864 [Erythroxylum novogranatense]|uniref:protein-serine/threonine phosphatase n=1 Tax=Erythroxylum novogranatense TaxID=1862640 RepID=A0AAV8SZJ5_9ROSI|nr:hypothetical protein K2173_006864 [Erythroxylum novogranatense]
MLVAGSNCVEWLNDLNGETLGEMGKDETAAKAAEDVEEGEISDTVSVEEISEEDFNKQEVKVVTESKTNESRVWTMRDLYKYQMGGGYVNGLYNLAWAQAVSNKPLNELFVDVETDENSKRSSPSSSVNSSTKDEKKVVERVVIDDSGDEKEEGELEEGEIDLDLEPTGKECGEEMSAGGLEVQSKEKDVDVRVRLIREALESVTVVEAEKSFEEVCSKLQNAMDSLQGVVMHTNFSTKNSLVQLASASMQTLKKVFCSMSQKLKGQNKSIFLRFLSFANSLNPPLFPPELLKEIQVMLSSLESTDVLLSSRSFNKDKQATFGVNEDYNALTNGAAHGSTPMNNLQAVTESFAHNKPNISLEAPKSGASGFKSKAIMLPLLDLHKDHDADSLPSPTRETTPVLPVGRVATVGDGMIKPVMPTPTVGLETGNSRMHPYETDALKAVSSYQQKFSRTSFHMTSRLPSPTPSEESGDGDTGGEVSSSSTVATSITVIPPISVPQSAAPPIPDSSVMHGVIPARNATPVSSISGSNTKSSAKSRDPRLRYVNSDANAAKVGETISLRKQRAVEDPILDGPLKRQRNGLENCALVKDVKTMSGSGGWLEDTEMVEDQIVNKTQSTDSSVSDPRRIVNGVSGSVKTTVNLVGNEQITVTGASSTTGNEQLPQISNCTTSLPDILKDIAVNPTMLLNILKMGQQQIFASEAQQKISDPAKSTLTPPISGSMLGKSPAVSVAPQQSSGILSRPAPPLQVPSQLATADDVAKIRMKPRDPRRVLHNYTLPRAGSLGSEQLKTNSISPLTAEVTKDDQSDQRHMGPVASQSTVAPDISLQFTKSLKNLANIVSVTQSSTTTPIGSQNLASQPWQIKPDRVDVKSTLTNSCIQTLSGDSAPRVGVSGPHSQTTWGDVEHLFEGYDDQQKAAIQRERARRIEEQKKMFAANKLCLVLDLDHTLLNSAKFSEVDPVHDEILRKKEEQDREKPYRHLFRFPHMGMWTKLRPGIWNFLERASKLYELHLYTMGNKLYATEMAKLLDPKGVLFAGRVISRGDDADPLDSDERVPKSKDLEGVLGMESAVVIIDDSVRVWPHNKLNLIVVERYIFFPCSRRQFGLPGPSLLEIDHDERPEDGTLACSLAVIERIHQNFFTHHSLDEADVRNILASEQRKILAGCRIVFSRVFPVGEANPHLHPLWQTAEQFGAVCTNQIDEQVTHVVANSLGTDKVNWAVSSGRHVVHPGWVEASALLYRRANEQDFAIKL